MERAPSGCAAHASSWIMVTVTGTENLMLAATLAEGTTLIENAAREPEVVDLARCLTRWARRSRARAAPRSASRACVRSAAREHRVMPDRIETGTYLAAVTATGGKVKLADAAPDTLDATLDKLREAGATIRTGERHIEIEAFGAAAFGEPAHRALSRLRHRHAGAVHGARRRSATAPR
jgi:UDP-N-acetylglucosamine 1-carboxyvinyltransferase